MLAKSSLCCGANSGGPLEAKLSRIEGRRLPFYIVFCIIPAVQSNVVMLVVTHTVPMATTAFLSTSPLTSSTNSSSTGDIFLYHGRLIFLNFFHILLLQIPARHCPQETARRHQRPSAQLCYLCHICQCVMQKSHCFCHSVKHYSRGWNILGLWPLICETQVCPQHPSLGRSTKAHVQRTSCTNMACKETLSHLLPKTSTLTPSFWHVIVLRRISTT